MATTEDYDLREQLSALRGITMDEFALVDTEMQNMSTTVADLAIRLGVLEYYVAGLDARVAAAQKTADIASGSAAAAQSTANNAGFMASALYKDAKEKGAME